MKKTAKELSREELLELYDEVGSFKEGMAMVRKGERYYRIYPDGTQVQE